MNTQAKVILVSNKIVLGIALDIQFSESIILMHFGHFTLAHLPDQLNGYLGIYVVYKLGFCTSYNLYKILYKL